MTLEADQDHPAYWPTCSMNGCIGVQVEQCENCLAHVDASTREAFLASLKPDSDVDLRGTPIDFELLEAILSAVEIDNSPRFRHALFNRAHFIHPAEFDRARFAGKATFTAALFSGDASFTHTEFSEGASFSYAKFSGFGSFAGGMFSEESEFWQAQFTDEAWFQETQFRGRASFSRARFDGSADFTMAVFADDASFDGAQFVGKTTFSGAEFAKDAQLRGASFQTGGALGPVMVAGMLNLAHTTFADAIVLECSASWLWCSNVVFKEGAALLIRRANLALDASAFPKPTSVSFATDPFKFNVWTLDLTREERTLNEDALKEWSPRPQLDSIRRVDVSNVVLADLDLTACLFDGAHNLDKLRIEGPLLFARAPTAWWRLRIGRWRLPVGRWAPRQVLAEEYVLRATPASSPPSKSGPRLERTPWHPPTMNDWFIETGGEKVSSLSPERLAVLYRAHRKALEDAKNAPSAADFYYGEMEMRRRSSSASRIDGYVLWIYWLTSGYGLRASRALTTFVFVVLVFSVPYWAWGFGHPRSFWLALLQSLESATSLLRPPPGGLSPIGELLDSLVRLLGTTLLGLGLFSLRSRIKR